MATLNANGVVHTHEAEPDTSLLWVMREPPGLTATNDGCGLAPCAACTEHSEDRPGRSCGRPVTGIGAAEQIATL